VSKRRGERGSGIAEPAKAVTAENATLRRALQREVAQRKRLQKDLRQETARRGEAEAALAEVQSHELAASEILRVISSSPTDLQPVFDTIAEYAMRVCGALHGVVLRFDGELIHLAALANASPEGFAAARRAFPTPPGRHTAAGRAIVSHRRTDRWLQRSCSSRTTR
jgi:hypothetical protein